MFLNIFLKKIFVCLGLRKISKFSRFSLDIATLDYHCSQTSNAMTKWLGTVPHLHVEKLQPREHVHWRYRVAATVSQRWGFRPKNRKKIKSSQNHLERIENHFKNSYEYLFLKIFFSTGRDIVYNRKIFEIEKYFLSNQLRIYYGIYYGKSL